MDLMEPPDDLFAESPIVTFWQKYKIPVLIGGGSLVCVVIALLLIVKTAQTSDPITFSSNSAVLAGETQKIMVDVAGGVIKPGVYELQTGARVEDAIIAAGGLSQNADTDLIAKTINRAKVVEDGVKVFIPMLGGNDTSHNNGFATSGQDSASSQNLGTIITTSGRASQNSAGSNLNSPLISINSASESELDSLPGVGPVTAQKIIGNRPYSDIRELVTKKAVGQSVFSKIQGLISL
jgi:competence protein ComEA